MKTKTHKYRRRKPSGFTLIEMLIVVAIVGILVAISVPALNSAKDDTATAKKNAITTAVETAKNRYALQNNVVGEDADFAEFAPYLIVNGQQVIESQIADGEVNGVGENITDYGTYAALNGSASPIVWGSGPPPLADFTSTNITGGMYDGEDWSNRNYTGATISNALVNLGANLTNSVFDNANLSGSHFNFGTIVTGASFEGANLENTHFTQAVGLTAEQLVGAANLNGVSLNGTGITQAIFEAAVTTAGGNINDPKYASINFDT